MKTLKNNWIVLKNPFNNSLSDALQQQHHAAQFIAMVGKHLIPQQSDDSNTNMEFVPEYSMIIGNPLPNGIQVALNLLKMELSIVDQNHNIKKIITLAGKTKEKIFTELTQNLADLGIDVANFKNELHYEIPAHKLDNGTGFSIKNKEDFIENANYRHNAKIVLNEVAQLFDQKELIRIWPHHFDTGAFFTISKNSKGEALQTIGIGYAIPDGMVDEPYYYLSFWSEKSLNDINNVDSLKAGNWMMPDWDGAILKHSEILKKTTAKEQHELVYSFFHQGIDLLNRALNN